MESEGKVEGTSDKTEKENDYKSILLTIFGTFTVFVLFWLYRKSTK